MNLHKESDLTIQLEAATIECNGLYIASSFKIVELTDSPTIQQSILASLFPILNPDPVFDISQTLVVDKYYDAGSQLSFKWSIEFGLQVIKQ